MGDTNYIFTRRPLTSEDEFTFITENEFITTGLTEENFPVKFDLKQNYPNPFNPTTTIEYSIPAISYSNSTKKEVGESGLMPVKLSVYNILGQKVSTLVDKELAPGHYRVQFNASGLASGVYFYNIQVRNKSISKKMILLR